MTARRPNDPMGSRLWELEQTYCGDSEHVNDLITLAWNIYHARAAALALAERRAGEIAAMKEQLRTLTSGFWYVDFHNPYLSAGYYLCLTADERVTMESLAAAPPPATAAADEDAGGTGNGNR
jgi:hypothetical protein